MARYTPHRQPRRAWSDTETEQLSRIHANHSIDSLAIIFGRHKSSVALKIKELAAKGLISPVMRKTGPVPKSDTTRAPRKARTKYRNTFSDTPAAPTGEEATAFLSTWQATQARRFKNRPWQHLPPAPVSFAVPVI